MNEFGIESVFEPFDVSIREEDGSVISKQIEIEQRRAFSNVIDVEKE